MSHTETETEAESTDLLPFVLRDPVARGGRTLEVQQLWGTTLLSSGQFRAGHGPVRIGLETGHRWRFLGIDMGFVPAALGAALPVVAPLWSEVEGTWSSDFCVDADGLPNGAGHTLFDVLPDGRVSVNVARSWEGFVELGGERLGWEALVARGLAEVTADGLRVELPDGARAVVECGGCVFVARRVTAAPRVRARTSEEPDRLFAGALVIGACLFLAAIGLSWTLPPVHRAESTEVSPELVELLLDLPTPPPEVAVASAASEESGPRARGDEGRPGRRDRRDAPRTDRQRAQSAGLLSVLDDDRFAEVLGSSALGAGLTGGVQGLIGSTGSGVGEGGFGDRGDGLGSGGEAESLGGIDTHGRERGGTGHFTAKREGEGITVGGDALIVGKLDRSLVDEVVKRNTPAIRYCYQRELQRQPGLAGKVVMKFTIAADGSVSAANVKSSTMGSPAVEQCLVGRFLRMSFPQPKGGGVVVVSYPFVFSS